MSGEDEGYSMILRFCLCSSYSSPALAPIVVVSLPSTLLQKTEPAIGASLLRKVHRHNLSGSSLWLFSLALLSRSRSRKRPLSDSVSVSDDDVSTPSSALYKPSSVRRLPLHHSSPSFRRFLIVTQNTLHGSRHGVTHCDTHDETG